MWKESVEGGCVGRARRVCSCPQGLEFRERERPEILVCNNDTIISLAVRVYMDTICAHSRLCQDLSLKIFYSRAISISMNENDFIFGTHFYILHEIFSCYLRNTTHLTKNITRILDHAVSMMLSRL